MSKNKETQTQTQELKTATIRSKREEIIKDVVVSTKAESANGGGSSFAVLPFTNGTIVN